jgi:hypothetical protein
LKERGVSEATAKSRDWFYSVKRRLIGDGRIAISDPCIWIAPKR